MTFSITSREAKTRIGYTLLGFFTFYLVAPVREWVQANLSLNPIIFGVAGLIVTLYIFEF